MDIVDAPIYDRAILQLVGRFAVDLFFLFLIVRVVYPANTTTKAYLFPFVMLNVLVFFICFTLKTYELGVGMALGLFALFAILRYRTYPIPIKEMTYLFLVIGIAVINALSGETMSYLELGFTNFSIVGIAALLEKTPLLQRELRKRILYERVDLIRPENRDELKADLEARTGLQIERIEVGRIDFLRDTVTIDVVYRPDRPS